MLEKGAPITPSVVRTEPRLGIRSASFVEVENAHTLQASDAATSGRLHEPLGSYASIKDSGQPVRSQSWIHRDIQARSLVYHTVRLMAWS